MRRYKEKTTSAWFSFPDVGEHSTIIGSTASADSLDVDFAVSQLADLFAVLDDDINQPAVKS